ncbi:lysophospholipase [Mycena maculata]|uniref:Lysophospholipase n=1 Tax=Mycena maculata TaxID=230809 RepID=A0AAD7IJ15_9AGAR|nr:lysophospholipase [Mycena maculata]
MMSFTEEWVTGAQGTSRYEPMHSAWAASGFAVFTYDLRGFGRTALDTPKSTGSAYGRMGRRYVTSTSPTLSKEIVGQLSGVISSSPWLLLTHPLPTVFLWIFTIIGRFFPNMHFFDPNSAQVDPWVREYGTYYSLYDILTMGMNLTKEGHKNWPKTIPVCQMNSCTASEEFFKVLNIEDKCLILYPGAFHDSMTEPDVKDQYQEDCIAWVEAHLSPTYPSVTREE